MLGYIFKKVTEMNDMQRQLLTDWRDALLRLEDLDWASRGFSMNWWAYDQVPTSPTLGGGTQCCAYGVGITLPSWKEAGLTLRNNLHKCDGRISYRPNPDAPDILGLTSDGWGWVTDPGNYDGKAPVSPGAVAKRITMLLDGDGPEGCRC